MRPRAHGDVDLQRARRLGDIVGVDRLAGDVLVSTVVGSCRSRPALNVLLRPWRRLGVHGSPHANADWRPTRRVAISPLVSWKQRHSRFWAMRRRYPADPRMSLIGAKSCAKAAS